MQSGILFSWSNVSRCSQTVWRETPPLVEATFAVLFRQNQPDAGHELKLATDAGLEIARGSGEAASGDFVLLIAGSQPGGISPGNWQRHSFELASIQVTLVLD